MAHFLASWRCYNSGRSVIYGSAVHARKAKFSMGQAAVDIERGVHIFSCYSFTISNFLTHPCQRRERKRGREQKIPTLCFLKYIPNIALLADKFLFICAKWKHCRPFAYIGHLSAITNLLNLRQNYICRHLQFFFINHNPFTKQALLRQDENRLISESIKWRMRIKLGWEK